MTRKFWITFIVVGALFMLGWWIIQKATHRPVHLAPKNHGTYDGEYTGASANYPNEPLASRWQPGDLEVIFFDVGQADGIGLRCPDGKFRVVDAGNFSDPIRQFMLAQKIERIDALVMTHPHQDHVGGVLALMDSFPIRIAYDAGVPHTTSTYKRILQTIEEKNIDYIQPRTGETLDWGSGLKVTVLHPDMPSYKNMNNNSIVLSIAHGKVRILLTGDAAAYAEDTMLKAVAADLPADVLKIGHHGSHSSSTDKFLEQVKPRFGVISVAINSPYGHPHPEVLEALDKHGIRFFRTDLHGTVTLVSDGDSYSIFSAHAPDSSIQAIPPRS